MSNNINYGEIICNAVDEIVTAKLQGLQYDITKQCTIVNDSSRKQGKYIVSDGSVKFEACSSDTTLSKGNSVLVTIPNGDYNMQKMIVGRVSADSTEPFNYKSPLNNMAKFTSNILDQPGITYPKENTGLQANGKIAIIGPIYSISDADNFSGFTRLGVSAEFRSWLSELNVIKGAYGIKLLVYVDGSSSPGVKNEIVYELTFSSEDMIGNPYQFDTYFQQEKVFDISSLNNIKKIDVYFYQDGQFYDGNNNYINYNNIFDNDIGLDVNEEVIALNNNLFVSNVAVYLGYESSMFEEETLMLYSSDPLTYHYLDYPPFTKAGSPKNLALRWVHKIDDTNFEILNGLNLDDKFEVHWFRYKPGAKEINHFAGPDWEEMVWPQDLPSILANINRQDFANEQDYQTEMERVRETYLEEFAGDRFAYSFVPESTNQQEQIKVIGYIKQGFEGDVDVVNMTEAEKLTNVIAYTSNILTFRNEEQVPDNLTYVASTQLTIAYEDSSDGNYFIYNQNGKIINEGDGQGHRRRIQARFKGAPLDSSFGTIDYIKWYFPYESQEGTTYTMLVNNEDYYGENGGSFKNDEKYEIEDYRGIDYLVITRWPAKDGQIDNYQSYAIKNTWYQANNNNIVRCVASINGVIYEAIEEMKFGKAGSQGTNITLVLDFMYGKNAIEYDPEKAISYAEAVDLTEEEFNSGVYYTYELVDKESLTYEFILATTYSADTNYFKKVVPESEIYVQAIMYDMAGKRIYDKYGTWNWSWYNGDNDIIKINDTTTSINDQGEEFEVAINSNIIRLSANLEAVPKENYAVLQVDFEQSNSTTLTAYLPIPIKQKGYSHIEGARDVIYNHQGVPTYYTDAYVLYQLDENDQYKEVNGNWNIYYEDSLETDSGKESKMSASYLPSLQKLTKEGKVYKALAASPFYASGYNNRVCVVCNDIENNNLVFWSQPILIMQSQYDFAMLNEWDGKLQTDESKGTILSTMLGAGRKNKNNTFSGVLIGDVQDATDYVEGGSYLKIGKLRKEEFKIGKYYTNRNYAYYPAFIYDENAEYYILQNLTGVYGLHEGQISFSLKENGIATFGKAGKGQIIINGNESTIRSPSFETEGRGLKLDLDDGLLHIKDKHKNKIIIKPDEPYLQVFGESSQVPIINIGDSDYFLQSDKYALGGLGSKLDLVKGTFNIKGSGGSVVLSGDKDESFFKVEDLSSNTLINMNNKEYYLQSATYGGNTQLILEKNNLKYLIYSDENGSLVALDALNKEDLYNVTEKGIADLISKWDELVNNDETAFLEAQQQNAIDAIALILSLDNLDLIASTKAEQFLFLQDNFELIKAIRYESLNSFNSMALKELKYNCIKQIIHPYLNITKDIVIYTESQQNENESLYEYPTNTNAIFIVKKYGIVEKAERYKGFIYQNNRWIATTNYTQMELNSMFALSELEFYNSFISINNINDGYLNLKNSSAWEFQYLYRIMSNLNINSSNVDTIDKILTSLFQINNFKMVENTDSTLQLLEKITIPDYTYEEIIAGSREEESEKTNYIVDNQVTAETFNSKAYYILDKGRYKIASSFIAGTTYYTRETQIVTELVEIIYPLQLDEYTYYLVPVLKNLAVEDGNITTYGVKCVDIELQDVYKDLYQIGELNQDNFAGPQEVATGRYDDKDEPIMETIIVDHDTGKAIYLSNLTPILVSSKPRGLKIDLNTGHIDGYDLYLQGIGDKGSFILNSSDENTPFKIGDNLSASWNGELFCQGVKYLGTVPKSGNNIINIGGGFYVRPDGTGRFNGSCASADWADNSDKLDGYHSSAFVFWSTYNGHTHSIKSISGSVSKSVTMSGTDYYDRRDLQAMLDSGRQTFPITVTRTQNVTIELSMNNISNLEVEVGPPT